MSPFAILIFLIFCSMALNIYTYFLGKQERDERSYEIQRLKDKYEALYRKVILELTHIKNRIKTLEEAKKLGRPKKNEKDKTT